MIPTTSQPVSCVCLTKDILDDILAEEYYTNRVFIVTPTANIFTIGNVENFEIIDYIDEYHLQYIIEDSLGVKRRILFEDGISNYGVLVNPNGLCNRTDGIAIQPGDADEVVEFAKYDTGELDQEPTIEIGETVEDEEEEDEYE